jgi:hypothetical protein
MDAISAILDDIDAGRLKPRSHEVMRRLAEHERSGAMGAEIVAAFDAGTATADQHLLEKLWATIESLPLAEQGTLRTLVSLVRPDEPIDGVHAEYLIGWAQDEGVPAEAIETAFRGG